MAICSNCGQDNPEGFGFCGGCGAALTVATAAPREERKVVTVLFCDLVGFTQRSEQLDPEDVRALVDPYWEHVRAELERFGGTVEKFIGDAVMALFGAPTAHEDDPERAVRAALLIRDWAREQQDVQVRIAVTTGEALVRLDADAARGQGVASGDVVNTAARLQSAAPVNGVLVGESTWRATQSTIEFEEREPVTAKGKAVPIRVWEALQARSRLGVDVMQQSRARFVGRERELDSLIDALSRAHEERSVQLVTLVGVPGIGKSRLVYQLMHALPERGELVTWRQGRSLPYGEGVSLWALGEMVKAEANILETDAHEETEAKLSASFAALLPGEDGAWALRHLRTLVGIGDGRGVGARDEAFAAWREYIEAIAERRPAVLVFEDLHWADDNLLDFIDHLVGWGSEVPLLVLATARPELLDRRPGWGGGKRNASTLSLNPLDAGETVQLVGELMDWSLLPPATQATILERAEGNPLYAEQFVRVLLESLDVDDPGLPETVQGIIAARLDALPLAEKELLQNAAVLGKVFWTGALEAIGGTVRSEADALLHSLVRKEFVRRERRPSLAGENESAFRHVLTRDVAYSQIPRAARAEKHRRAAEWIRGLGRPDDHAEMLAHHYSAALELSNAAGLPAAGLPDLAREALELAGDRALALSSYSAAVRYYDEAIALAADETQRALLSLSRARALHATGDDDELEAFEHARDLLAAAGLHESAAEAEALLGEAWWFRGRVDLSREAALRAAASVAGGGVTPARTRVLVLAARAYVLANDHEHGLPLAEEALALAEELGLEEERVKALMFRGIGRVYAGDVAGLDDLWKSVALATEIGSPEAARARHNLSVLLISHGDQRRVDELEAEAIVLAERVGNVRMVEFFRASRLFAQYSLGDWDGAMRTADTLLDGFGPGSPPTIGTTAHWLRAKVEFARSHEAEALRALEDALASTTGPDDREPRGWVLDEATLIYAELGRMDDARAAFDEGAALPGARLSLDTALVAVELGREAAARELLERDAATTRSEAYGLLLAGEPARAAELLLEISDLTAEAMARLRAADQFVEQGRMDDAGLQLDRAVAFFRSVGAERYIRQAESLLAAAR